VYGTAFRPENVTLEALRRYENRITRALGTTQLIRENRPQRFREQIETFADSANTTTEMAFWPIVKKVPHISVNFHWNFSDH
jgi:hypothetical protein